MRKISIFAALVVAMTAVSCVEDINSGVPAVNDGAVTFEASFGVMSKAVLEPGATESKVAWEAGDQVGVLVGEGNYLYSAATAGYSTTLSTEATGVPSEGTYYAVYPYDSEAVLAEGVITTSLPAEQTAVLGSFTTHLAVAQTTSDNLAFKNVCGLVKVTVDAENVTKVVFEGNSGEVVAGGINITVSDTPSWAAVAEQGATSVTLAPVSGTLAKGAYYFAVLPQTFAAGFKVTAYKGDEAWVIRNVTASTIVERTAIVGGKAFFEIEGNGTEANPYLIKNLEQFKSMRSLATLGGETWFKLCTDIDMKDVTDYVPLNYDQGYNRKVHFDGDNHTIDNFTSEYDAYPSLFGVLYGSVKNLKVTNPVIISTGNVAGVIGGYVGTTNKPATVENVTVTNASVTGTTDRTGGICGHAKGATFKNVSYQGTVTNNSTGESKSGGFVGQSEVATYEKCTVDVTMVGKGTDLGGFAGKISEGSTFTDCNVKAVMESYAATKNRCGGFIGWNASAKTTITNCHVLEGSTLTDKSERTTASNGNYGGFIGFGDTTGTELVITSSSAKATVNAGVSNYNSVFIGGLGYASTITIKNSYASGSVTSSGAYTGGLLGSTGSSTVTIEGSYASASVISSANYAGGLCGHIGAGVITVSGSYFDGTVKGASGVGGLIGGNEKGTVTISTSYVKGTVNNTGHNAGGMIGLSSTTTVVENCWTSADVIMSSGQYGGGIVGGTQGAKISLKNCYSMGKVQKTRGLGGILGQAPATTTEVVGCIAWGSIETSRAANQYSPGAIVGNIQVNGTYKNCYRKADMEFSDVAMTLVDHEDVESGRPPLPTYEGVTADNNQYAYHGKAAGADATISSVAKTAGWDETVWDLSGDVPVLK